MPAAVTSNQSRKNHIGPTMRVRRSASGITMSQTAHAIQCDLGKLSRFERGQADLSPEKLAMLEDVITAALRSRSRAVEAAMAVAV